MVGWIVRSAIFYGGVIEASVNSTKVSKSNDPSPIKEQKMNKFNIYILPVKQTVGEAL